MSTERKSSGISSASRIVRRLFLVLWATIVAFCVGWYLYDPSAFSADHIATFLERFAGPIWLIYFLFSMLRGLTLLPSTPLVLAGTILFPAQPWAVLAVSMLGITISSTMIYYLSDYLGFTEYFEKHNPEATHKIKAKLERPFGSLIVAGWAFFPFVPTDLVCYLAGTTKMNFARFIAAIFAGELVLCFCYVFLGGSLLKFVR